MENAQLTAVTIGQFNDDSNFVSPASGDIWSFDHALGKLIERSAINAEKEVKLLKTKTADFGDLDLHVSLRYTTSSMWTNSPDVSFIGEIPLHVSVNNDISFGHYIDQQEADLSKFVGGVIIDTKDERIIIKFTLSELSEEQLEVIKEAWVAAQERIETELFKNWLLGQQ